MLTNAKKFRHNVEDVQNAVDYLAQCRFVEGSPLDKAYQTFNHALNNHNVQIRKDTDYHAQDY